MERRGRHERDRELSAGARLSNIPVAVLRERDIRNFQDELIREGHALSNISRIGSVLGAALNLVAEGRGDPRRAQRAR